MADGNSASASASQSSDPPPPLVALFLIKFDLKIGYTISWKRSLPSIPLEGVVEYKSLPSGLHKVKSDLVYFVHEQQFAGVSAFQNVEASAGERNARFVSVGALVRLGDGRLGRAWEHAGQLRELVEQVVGDVEDVRILEDYWERWREREGQEDQGERRRMSSSLQRRSRALSSLTLGGLSAFQQRLSPYHPAYSILSYLDTFGPLAFPLHRIALLRKRVLVVTPVPVKLPCEYVYDLSILSSLPHSLLYTPPSSTLHRLRPLFNLGIHDIPYLTDLSKIPASSDSEEVPEESTGWTACTTDEILAMKPDLYDFLVEMPNPDRPRQRSRGRRPKNKGTGATRWPLIKLGGSGEEIKATQRDLRRYRSLRRALAPLARLENQRKRVGQNGLPDEDDEETHLLFNSVHGNFTDEGEEELQHRQDEEQVTERASWGELAYSSFMWWASAGEREEGLKTEDDQDAALLGNLPEVVEKELERRRYRDEESDTENGASEAEKSAEVEMAVIAYFHRITKSLFENSQMALQPDARPVSTEAVDEDEDEDEAEAGSVRFESEDLRRCGLDVWSARDRLFISEFIDLWFERDVSVRGAGVECCGMRIY